MKLNSTLLIVGGLTLILIGLGGIFNIIPALGQTVTPMVGATISLSPASKCFITQCNSFGTSFPLSFSGVTDNTGTVSFAMQSFTTGAGSIGVGTSQCSVTYGPGFTVTITPANPAIAKSTYDLQPYLLTSSCPPVLLGYPQAVGYIVNGGSQSVQVILNCGVTGPSPSSCAAPQPTPTIAYLLTLLGAGITVVGLVNKQRES